MSPIALAAVLCFLSRPALGGPKDVFIGMIDQVNQFLIDNHFDSLDLKLNQRFSWFLYSFEVKGLYVGNFSTISFINEPVINLVEEKNYNFMFKLPLGWSSLKAALDYSASFFPFSSSGTAILYDTGMALEVDGQIVGENNVTCKVILVNAILKDLGDLQLTIQPSSINNWILKQVANIGLSIFNRFFSNILRNPIQNIINLYIKDYKLPEVELPCSYFELV